MTKRTTPTMHIKYHLNKKWCWWVEFTNDTLCGARKVKASNLICLEDEILDFLSPTKEYDLYIYFPNDWKPCKKCFNHPRTKLYLLSKVKI